MTSNTKFPFFPDDQGPPRSPEESEIETGLLKDFIRGYIEKRRVVRPQEDLKEALELADSLVTVHDFFYKGGDLMRSEDDVKAMFRLDNEDKIERFSQGIFTYVWKLTTRNNSRDSSSPPFVALSAIGSAPVDDGKRSEHTDLGSVLHQVFVEPYLEVKELQNQMEASLENDSKIDFRDEKIDFEGWKTIAKTASTRRIVVFGSDAKQHYIFAQTLLNQRIDFDQIRGGDPEVVIFEIVREKEGNPAGSHAPIDGKKLVVYGKGELLFNDYSIVLIDEGAVQTCPDLVNEYLKNASIFIPVLPISAYGKLGNILSLFTRSLGNDFHDRGFIIFSSDVDSTADAGFINDLCNQFQVRLSHVSVTSFASISSSLMSGEYSADYMSVFTKIANSNCVKASADHHLSTVMNQLAQGLSETLKHLFERSMMTRSLELLKKKIGTFLEPNHGLSRCEQLTEVQSNGFDMMMVRLKSERRSIEQIIARPDDPETKERMFSHRLLISLQILCRKLFYADLSSFQGMLREWSSFSDDVIFTPMDGPIVPVQLSQSFVAVFAKGDASAERAVIEMKAVLRKQLKEIISHVFDAVRRRALSTQDHYDHPSNSVPKADAYEVLFKGYREIFRIGFAHYRGSLPSTDAEVSAVERFGDEFYMSQLRDRSSVLIRRFQDPSQGDGSIRELFSNRIVKTLNSKRLMPVKGLVLIRASNEQSLFIVYDHDPQNSSCSLAFSDANMKSPEKRNRIRNQLADLAQELRKIGLSLSFLSEKNLFWNCSDSYLKVLSLNDAVYVGPQHQDEKGWEICNSLIHKLSPEQAPTIRPMLLANLPAGEHAGMALTRPSTDKWNVLTVDGGGCRGIVAAKIIAAIEAEVERQGGPKQASMAFDLIGGTSAGGLNSLAIGLVGLTGVEAVQAVREIVNSVFGINSSPSMWSLTMGYLEIEEEGATTRTTELQSKIEEYLGHESLAVEAKADPPLPKVFVTSTNRVLGASYLSEPIILRSYPTPDDVSNQDWQRWEAGRATSAAPGYFYPLEHSGHKYFDGGILANNPSKLALQEVRKHGKKVRVLVSVGCGHGDGFNPVDWGMTLAGVNTNTEDVHEEMEVESQDSQVSFTYFRLNPPIRPEFNRINLSPNQLEDLARSVDDWLQQEQRTLQEIASSIISGA